MAPPTWFEIYGMPGSGKSSSRAWFWQDLCQQARAPKGMVNLGTCLMDEKTIQQTFDRPHKHAYFTQRQILKNYFQELNQLGHTPDRGDLVIEHVPLGTIQCFNTALYFHGYFPVEGMHDLQVLEDEVAAKRTLMQLPYVIKRVYIDIPTETCLKNLQERNPAVYGTKNPASRFDKHFLRVMNLTNAVLGTYVKGLYECQRVTYEHGVLFDGHLKDLYLKCKGSTNHGLDFVDRGGVDDKMTSLLPAHCQAGPTFSVMRSDDTTGRKCNLGFSALTDIDEEDEPMPELDQSLKKLVM